MTPWVDASLNFNSSSSTRGYPYPVCKKLIFFHLYIYKIGSQPINRGWSGGAKVLGKLPVPGRPTSLDYSRTRAYCACSRCGWGLFGHFSLIYHFSFLSPRLWETARYRLKYCLKGPLNPKQPTNQPINRNFCLSLATSFLY